MTNDNADPSAHQGRPIEYISIESLHFDPHNPRLPPSVDGSDDQAVLRWMLRDATIVELMSSIGQSGYFDGEPVLAIERSDELGQYEVVEGNRRLAAVKLLQEPARAPVRQRKVTQTADDAIERPDELPVILYGSRDELLEYLGYRHVTGIKEWDPKAKARHLETLRAGLEQEEAREQQRILAKTIGSRSDYVGRLLTGLRLYDHMQERDFYGIVNDDDRVEEDPVEFSLLTTALSYANICDFLGLESNRDPSLDGLGEDNVEELTRWLFEEDESGASRVPESRSLRQLSKVVAHEAALEAFRGGDSLDSAFNLTGGPAEIFRDNLKKARSHLSTAWTNLPLIDTLREADSDLLKELVRLAHRLKQVVDDELLDSRLEAQEQAPLPQTSEE